MVIIVGAKRCLICFWYDEDTDSCFLPDGAPYVLGCPLSADDCVDEGYPGVSSLLLPDDEVWSDNPDVYSL